MPGLPYQSKGSDWNLDTNIPLTMDNPSLGKIGVGHPVTRIVLLVQFNSIKEMAIAGRTVVMTINRSKDNPH